MLEFGRVSSWTFVVTNERCVVSPNVFTRTLLVEGRKNDSADRNVLNTGKR